MVSKNKSLTPFQFLRQQVDRLRKAQLFLDILAILSVVAMFVHYVPMELFNANPATGGDTGSHFWPLYTLVKQGLPNWHVRVWNPGNLGGEPHLTHYFPLPYFVMSFLSLFMPLGRAFNIGTILPVGLLPICVYFCFRGLKAKFPVPLLAMIASLSFLYNESFSMWGGNAISTLAGQFAHVYAFDFFLLGFGVLNYEMTHKRQPFYSGILFAAVFLSHFYMALMIPILFLVFLAFDRTEIFKLRFQKLILAGLLALGLAAWFVIPMLHNSPWNTAFGLKWGGENLINEIAPKIFWPFGILVGLGVLTYVGFAFRKKLFEREWRILIPAGFALIGFGGIYYLIFPTLGLVDVRVIPTIQLSVVILGATFLGITLRRFLSKPWVWAICFPLVMCGFYWAGKQVVNFPGWMKWNYSGWEAKSAYPDLKRLSDQVRGDFSDPRIIYENNDLSNAAGTIRVFEMMPYFAGRSVLESVYMQATVVAPMAFYLQALISKTPSCPFPNYQCTNYKVSGLWPYMDLMGISQIIVITPEVQAQADHSEFLKKQGDFGNWHLYGTEAKPELVGTISQMPEFVDMKSFKKKFYDWFREYKLDSRFLMADLNVDEESKKLIAESLAPVGKCHPKLKVEFDQMHLSTDCPGKLHFIKFAYHPTWQASTGDKLFLTSPGFIGVIPSATEVNFKWGQHWLWTLANSISWLTLVGVLISIGFQIRKKVKVE